MATIKAGTYVLAKTLNLPSSTLEIIPYPDISVGSLTIDEAGSIFITSTYISVYVTGVGNVTLYENGAWTNDEYRTWVLENVDSATDGTQEWLDANLYVPEAKFVRLIREDQIETEEKTVYPKTTSQSVTPTEGKFLSKVNITGVQVQNLPTITPSKSKQTFVPDTDYFYEQVIVNPIADEYVIPSGSVIITENGTYDVSGKASVTVNVETTTVTEVLGYEKSVSGDTVDFELMNELPEATSVKGARGFIVVTMDSIEESYVTKIECYYDGALVKESENNSSGTCFHAVPLNFDVDTIKVTFSTISAADLTLKVLTGYGELDDVESATTMSVSNNVVTITNVENAYNWSFGWDLVLCSSYVG